MILFPTFFLTQRWVLLCIRHARRSSHETTRTVPLIICFLGAWLYPGGLAQVRRQDPEQQRWDRVGGEGEERHVQEADRQTDREGCGETI